MLSIQNQGREERNKANSHSNTHTHTLSLSLSLSQERFALTITLKPKAAEEGTQSSRLALHPSPPSLLSSRLQCNNSG